MAYLQSLPSRSVCSRGNHSTRDSSQSMLYYCKGDLFVCLFVSAPYPLSNACLSWNALVPYHHKSKVAPTSTCTP